MAILLSGCTGKRDRYEPGVLRMNLGTEPPSLDWHTTTDSTSFDVISNIMVGLTQYTDELDCIPSCAKSWEILDGGTRYVFHLRDDVKWTDGKPLTAYDFEYAWRRLEDPETGASYAFFLYDVINAFEINTGKNKDVTSLGAKALDDLTFEVRLKKPAAYFIYLTAHCPSFPMRKDTVEENGDRWTEPANIVTNGPFVLSKWQHEYKIELSANKGFFAGPPPLKKVKMFMVPEQSTAFALYENDELDYVDNRSFSTSDIDRYRTSPEYQSIPLLRGTYIGCNVQKPPFTDKRIRQAFSMAIDRNVFPLILRRGERPTTHWIPSALMGSTPESGLKFDVPAARRLLARAGFPEGKGLPPVSLLYPNREDSRLVVEALQAQLKKNLGVRIQLVNQEWKVYLATRKKDPPPLFRASWGADYPDPETFMNLFTSTNGNNHTRWKNKTYDRLVSIAGGELDEERRASLYRRADRLLCKDEVPILPMYVATQNVLLKPWTRGISFNALDIQYFKRATVGDRAQQMKGTLLDGELQPSSVQPTSVGRAPEPEAGSQRMPGAEQSVPEKSVPNLSVPMQSVPGKSVPDQSIPAQSVPESPSSGGGA